MQNSTDKKQTRMAATIDAIKVAAITNRPFVLVGADGEGKTSYLRQMCRDLDWGFYPLIGANMDPTDIGGLPNKGPDGELRRDPLHRAIREAIEYARDGKHYLILIDEVNGSPDSVLASIQTMLSEWTAGDVELCQKYVHFGCAMNPTDIATAGKDFQPPMCTRLIWIPFQQEFEFWCNGMVSQGWAPVEQAGLVIGFIRAKGIPSENSNGVFRDPPTREFLNKPRRTPRTWTNLANLLAEAEAQNVSRQSIRILVSGTIGEGPATEFMDYWKERDSIAPPEEILARAGTYPFPARLDHCYMMYNSVASYVLRTKKVEDWKALWTLIGRSDESIHKAEAMLAARVCIRILTTPEGKHLRKHLPKEVKVFKEMFQDLGLLTGASST